METVRTGTITKSSQYSFSLAFGANTTSYNVNISIKFAFTSSYKTVTTTEITRFVPNISHEYETNIHSLWCNGLWIQLLNANPTYTSPGEIFDPSHPA